MEVLQLVVILIKELVIPHAFVRADEKNDQI
jgi:hypothetical protein